MKSRLLFLTTVILFAAIVFAPPSFFAAERPNLIFLFTDDQRDDTFSGMGHPFVKTPAVDALLANSVRFTNCYTAEPVCAPSRVSVLTGMYERVHGIGFTSSYQLTEAQWERSYPALLRKAGYLTGFIGKIGIEYYTFKGKAAEKFDYWWGHDGWTKFLPKDHNSPSTNPYHRAKEENDVITAIMGEAMGEHGMGGKSLLYDLASKIPCFVHDPTLSGEQRGREVDALVSSLDFPVTLLDYAGVEAPEFMDGRSLRPLVQGRSAEEIEWRTELFLESLYTGRDTPFQEGIREGKWKYIRMYDGQKPSYDESHVDFAGRKPEFEMLFDLKADPGETSNLIEAQEGSEMLARLREKVAAQSAALNEKREAFKKAVEVKER